MSKDPAFLFYPGDYLKDTQCLSEKTQVSYDRIMCEHMRNICIRQDQVNFFTKRLSEDEKSELLHLLKKVPGGFQIEWVAESISKRKAYSESRRNNRASKPKNISSTYDSHMENAIENVIENKNVLKTENWESIKNNFFNAYQWQEKFCRDKGILITVLQTKMQEFISDVELREDYKDLKELKSHFTNLFNKQKNGFKPTETGGRHRGALQLVASLKQDFAAGGKKDT